MENPKILYNTYQKDNCIITETGKEVKPSRLPAQPRFKKTVYFNKTGLSKIEISDYLNLQTKIYTNFKNQLYYFKTSTLNKVEDILNIKKNLAGQKIKIETRSIQNGGRCKYKGPPRHTQKVQFGSYNEKGEETGVHEIKEFTPYYSRTWITRANKYKIDYNKNI